jgi:hypothetical protein
MRINQNVELFYGMLSLEVIQADLYKYNYRDQTSINIIIEIKFIVMDFDKYLRLIDLETS